MSSTAPVPPAPSALYAAASDVAREAGKTLNAVVTEFPGYSQGHLALGLWLLGQKQNAPARKALAEAVSEPARMLATMAPAEWRSRPRPPGACGRHRLPHRRPRAALRDRGSGGLPQRRPGSGARRRRALDRPGVHPGGTAHPTTRDRGRQCRAPPVIIAPPSCVPAPAERTVDALTSREIELLRLLHAGLSNQKLADALLVSVPTIKWHLHNVYSKLGVGSRGAAVAHAIKSGFISR